MLPEKADKAFRWFVRSINERMYGKRWMRTPHGGVLWARGSESHANGRPHFHAVMAAPDQDLNVSLQRYAWHELWYREFGRNQIEQPRNQDEVSRYVSKYVTKLGEVDFSHNFGRVLPPPIPWADCNDGSRAAKPSLPDTRIGRSGGALEDPPRRAGLSLTLPVCPRFGHADFAVPNDESDLEEPDL